MRSKKERGEKGIEGLEKERERSTKEVNMSTKSYVRKERRRI